MSAYLFRAEWPIDDSGLDLTLAQLAQSAALDLPDLLVLSSALAVGPVSWRIALPEDPTGTPALVAECDAVHWTDPVRSIGARRKLWAVTP
jgi:hypothetical protein